MMDVARRRIRRQGWDLAVCVTDLSLRDGKQPIVAALRSGRRAVVVSTRVRRPSTTAKANVAKPCVIPGRKTRRPHR